MKNDLTAKTFGRLTVLSFAFKRSGSVYYLCKCECGREKYILRSSLIKRCAISCGCVHIAPKNNILQQQRKFESNENLESYF
jgi:hypothetical protein